MFDDLKKYIANRLTLSKYEFIDSTSNMLSTSVYGILLGVSILFMLLLLSIAGGYFLGSLFGNNGLGFLAMTGIYFLMILFFALFRKNIKLLITDKAVESAMSAINNLEEENGGENKK